MMGLTDTHKNFWECDTGIAFLVSGVPGWRVKRMTQVYDLSDPAHPVHIRDFGLPGQEPGATGTIPTQLHGAISMGPKSNRVYFGYGTDKGGVLQIVDREKLLTGPKEPTPDNLRYPEVSKLEMSAWYGAHTTFPMLQMPIAEFAKDKDGAQARHRDDRRRADPQRVPGGAPDGVVRRRDAGEDADHRLHLPGPRGERPLLRARRPVRPARLEREHGPGVLREGGDDRLLQRRRPRDRRAQSRMRPRRSPTTFRRSPRRPTSAASRSTARTAARPRSRPTTPRPTTAA